MDFINPDIFGPLALIIWLILIVVTIVTLRYNKVQRDIERRRKTYIKADTMDDVQYRKANRTKTLGSNR